MKGGVRSATISWVPPPASAGVRLSSPFTEVAATGETTGHAAPSSKIPIKIGRTMRVGLPSTVLRPLCRRLSRGPTPRLLGPVPRERNTSDASSCHYRKQEWAGQLEAFRSDLESGRPFGDVAASRDGSENDCVGPSGQ